MAYREQAYQERSAERCFCDATVVARCRCCRRPRCAEHRARGLCSRCGQALAHRRAARTERAWWLGGLAGFVTLGLVAALHVAVPGLALAVGLAVAPVVAIAGGLGVHRRLVARDIARLRPQLATTVGELAAPAEEAPFPEAPPPRIVY